MPTACDVCLFLFGLKFEVRLYMFFFFEWPIVMNLAVKAANFDFAQPRACFLSAYL